MLFARFYQKYQQSAREILASIWSASIASIHAATACSQTMILYAPQSREARKAQPAT